MLNNLYTILYLAKFKLEVESKRSFLGILWWFIDPMFVALTYFLLFSFIRKGGGSDFIYFLFIGVFTWRWLDNTIVKASMAIKSQANMLKKIYVKKDVLVYSEVLAVLAKFLIIFVFVYAVYGVKFGFHLNHLFLPVVMGAQFALALGAGMVLASLVPFFPDLRLVHGYLMKLAFYPSGILFSLSRVPEPYASYLKLNPLVGLFENYRNILIYNKSPNLVNILIVAILGLGLFALGWWLIKKFDRKYVKYLM